MPRVIGTDRPARLGFDLVCGLIVVVGLLVLLLVAIAAASTLGWRVGVPLLLTPSAAAAAAILLLLAVRLLPALLILLLLLFLLLLLLAFLPPLLHVRKQLLASANGSKPSVQMKGTANHWTHKRMSWLMSNAILMVAFLMPCRRWASKSDRSSLRRLCGRARREQSDVDRSMKSRSRRTGAVLSRRRGFLRMKSPSPLRMRLRCYSSPRRFLGILRASWIRSSSSAQRYRRSIMSGRRAARILAGGLRQSASRQLPTTTSSARRTLLTARKVPSVWRGASASTAFRPAGIQGESTCSCCPCEPQRS